MFSGSVQARDRLRVGADEDETFDIRHEGAHRQATSVHVRGDGTADGKIVSARLLLRECDGAGLKYLE